MAMNVPVIMGVRGQAREIVEAPRAGLAMTPEDEDSLIAGIDAIAATGTPFAGAATTWLDISTGMSWPSECSMS